MLQSCTDLEVDGSTALDEAKATVETIELFAEVAQESVKAAEECAAKAGITLVAVPAIDNVESAGAILSQAGFTPSFIAKPNTEKSLDFKLATPHTSPGPGEMAKRGSVVTVFVYQKAADSAEPKVTTPQATWVRSEPVIASNGQNGRVPKRMQVSANSLSYGTKSDGKDFANTLKWSSPPAEIKVNDTISLTINSSSQEGPANVGGWWNINCAEKGSLKGDTSAGSTKNYRATGSPDSHNAACTFKFVPQGGDASIQFSGGHDPAPDTWVTVTWTYKRKDAVKDKGAD
jgi:hypothetical protein